MLSLLGLRRVVCLSSRLPLSDPPVLSLPFRLLAGCIVFASNILVAAGHEVTIWNERGIAVAVIVSITLIHGLIPKIGIKLMNLLAIFKIVLLLLVVVSGWVVLAGGVKSIPDPKANFRNGFAGTTSSAYFWASGLFKVINSFSGWSNATYVLNEVRQSKLSSSVPTSS